MKWCILQMISNMMHISKNFNEKTLQVLKGRGIEMCKIIYFSDQASSQYKNKTSFNYMCQSSYAVMKNFFATRHGKGPCDGCAGHVKQKVTTLVKTETAVVNSPETFNKFCKKERKHLPQMENVNTLFKHFNTHQNCQKDQKYPIWHQYQIQGNCIVLLLLQTQT